MMTCFIARRIKLMEHMQTKGGGLAIIANSPKVIRNGDIYYPYRHDSYFYYLSGFTEPEAVIVLIVAKQNRSILFCRDKNLDNTIWNGDCYGPAAACKQFSFEEAFSIETLDKKLPLLLSDISTVFYTFGRNTKYDIQFRQWLKHAKALERNNTNNLPVNIVNINILLDEFRLFKSANEIKIIQRACTISAEAHCIAMKRAHHGLCEYQLEAELLYIFRRNGSQFPAYNSIVATGINACILHYSAGKTKLIDKNLVLIDAGCEFNGYAADITRTFPVNGIFSSTQKILYEIVLAAHNAALAELHPGKNFIDSHTAAVRVLAEGMLDIGLLNKNKVGTLDDVINKQEYRKFYMHNTAHWLGMDVHDVGNYHDDKTIKNSPSWRILEPGMVLAIEPGIYIRPTIDIPKKYWNIGIRIEDNVYITPEGYEILTTGVPSKIADIEIFMRSIK